MPATDIPPAVRREVLDRDQHCCRLCGVYVTTPALHHITYRSHGGLHVPENLVTIGWLPGHECHLTHAHGPRAALFAQALAQCALNPGATAIQLIRWNRSARN